MEIPYRNPQAKEGNLGKEIFLTKKYLNPPKATSHVNEKPPLIRTEGMSYRGSSKRTRIL